MSENDVLGGLEPALDLHIFFVSLAGQAVRNTNRPERTSREGYPVWPPDIPMVSVPEPIH